MLADLYPYVFFHSEILISSRYNNEQFPEALPWEHAASHYLNLGFEDLYYNEPSTDSYGMLNSSFRKPSVADDDDLYKSYDLEEVEVH